MLVTNGSGNLAWESFFTPPTFVNAWTVFMYGVGGSIQANYITNDNILVNTINGDVI